MKQLSELAGMLSSDDGTENSVNTDDKCDEEGSGFPDIGSIMKIMGLVELCRRMTGMQSFFLH